MKDFTHKIYKELLTTSLKSGYKFIRVKDFFNSNYKKNNKFIIMRHDVDRRPNSSLIMAKIEADMGIKSTYYFRTIAKTLKPDIIREIASLGHEIGYHYESLAQTNGNYKKAIEDFEYNLNRLRELYPIENIAMHGRPTSKWDSRDLWKEYNYKYFNITSEPYFDFNFNDILYITDAGRAWGDDSINLRDRVDTDIKYSIKSTIELISVIKKDNLLNKMMINIHPEHWAGSNFEWYKIITIRKSKNSIKKIILKR